MRQAIETRYLGPTDHRGSRVKATAQAGSVTIEWNDALNSDENHTRAAQALCKKFEWVGELIAGGKADGTGNVYVLLSPGYIVLRADCATCGCKVEGVQT